VASCQLIAGIEDKSLDPQWNALSDASVDSLTTDSSGSDAANDAANDSASDAGAAARRPPERPDGPAVASGKGAQRIFVAKAMYLGSVDPGTQAKDPEAWRKLGYDIDGKCTSVQESTSDNSGVCKKPNGANSLSEEDGYDCIDNAGGRLFSGTTQWLSVDLELSLQARIVSGDSATLLLILDDVDDGPDDPYVPARLYVTAPRTQGMGPPIWNGADLFVLDQQWLGDGGIDSPRYKFEHGYIRDNVWVSGDFNKSPAVVPMMMLDRIEEISTESTTLTLTFSDDRTSVSASTLSAVVASDELGTHLWPIFLDAMSCNVNAANTFVATGVKPNADLSSQGDSFVDPTRTCDAVSLGSQFLWVPAKMPVSTVAVTPMANPCSDAGLGDGAADSAGLDSSDGDAGSDSSSDVTDAKAGQ
jgi:hypothetical protein